MRSLVTAVSKSLRAERLTFPQRFSRARTIRVTDAEFQTNLDLFQKRTARCICAVDLLGGRHAKPHVQCPTGATDILRVKTQFPDSRTRLRTSVSRSSLWSRRVPRHSSLTGRIALKFFCERRCRDTVILCEPQVTVRKCWL